MADDEELNKDSSSVNREADFPLKILKEELQEYLPFLSIEFCVCDVCGDKLRVRDFAEHVEYVHYEPPGRTWSTGPKAGWRRRARLYE